MFENSSLVTFYAITPCHVGCESSLGVVDSPIQRERHTNWPIIPASGLKGAMRHAFARKTETEDSVWTNRIFGSDDSVKAFAGAISVLDVQILAFPMRSSSSTFVWITSPSVLKRYYRICAMLKKTEEQFKEINLKECYAIKIRDNNNLANELLIEDLVVQIKDEKNEAIKEYAKFVGSIINDLEIKRLYVVSDEVFDTYAVKKCTQVSAQIKIDDKTGTTADGSLRYQEELPSDTLMYSAIFWNTAKDGTDTQAETIKKEVKEKISNYIQVGGDMTMGKGIFKINWGA